MYKVGMISLGCPKNQVDGEAMLFKLAEAGFEIVTAIEDSDVMIVNTCGFIESAKQEAIETILEVASYKEAGLIQALVVTGCLAERYQEEIKQEMPEVDAVIGIGANGDIVKVCQKALCGVETTFFPDKCHLPLDTPRTLSTPSHYAYLKIAEGCDNHCSYCAIPLIRGAFRSRPMESVLEEAQRLVNQGVKEIILIAQDTTKYGKDIYGEYKLAELLKQLVKIDNLEWIRLLYCYPQRMTDELIDVMAQETKICRYLDLPLQHADGEVLKRMNRFGDADAYLALLKKLRSKIPDIALRTTFMVGFPQETQEEFETLCLFAKQAAFDKFGVFTFSPEEDTPAADMEGQIEEAVKQRRMEVLMELQYTITQAHNEVRCGKVYRVLIDEVQDDVCIGRAYFDAPEIDSVITFKPLKTHQSGEFANIKITGADGYDLIGEEIA